MIGAIKIANYKVFDITNFIDERSNSIYSAG